MKSKEIIVCLIISIGFPYMIGAYVLNNFNPMSWTWEHRENQIVATSILLLLTFILNYVTEREKEELIRKEKRNAEK